MSIILDLLTTLKANADINAFFNEHYRKNPKHFLGYKSAPVPEELPMLCYVPLKSDIKELKPSTWVISIVIMLDDDRLLDENLNELSGNSALTGDSQLMSGVVRSEQAQALLTTILTDLNLPNGGVIDRGFKITTDMSFNYPFFQSEIVLEVDALNYY